MVGERPRGRLLPLNKYVAIAALFALCLSLIELSEVVELPFGGLISGTSPSSIFSSSTVIALMRSLGYVSLFTLMTLESASLPIPSEIVLPFAGYLVYLGLMNFEVAIVVSTVAGLAGALVDYYIALLLGRAFAEKLLRRFGVGSGILERAERWFDGKGSWTVLIARFVPLLRSVISFPAGLFRMRLTTFVVMTVIGCFGWSAVLIYAGYAAGQLWNQVVGSSWAIVATAVVATIALASAFYVSYFAYSMRKGTTTIH